MWIVTISPFRTETNPLFLIGNRNGGLSFIDFGDTSKKRRLFYIYKNVVQSWFYGWCIKMIDKDFHLGISSGIYTGEHKRLLVNINNLKN
jgi:hypothetical protein